MPKQTYNWKRFWCPRSGRINLADGGFLYDPETEYGKVYNPDLVTLEEIANIPCLVLLGEPGVGKSQELENLKTFTEKKSGDSSQVLELNLRSCTNLKEDLFRDEIFSNWLAGAFHLYLFLDSLDEGLLSIPNIATGLIDELNKPKYKNHIKCLHFRIACRTFVFPEVLEEGLKGLWEKAYSELEQHEYFAIYELAPLRRADVIESIKAEGLSSDDFLQEIAQKDIVSLAIKPITLRFLLNRYRRHGGQFPQNQKLHELYLEGCKLLCEEVNESRQASNQIGCLDGYQRLIIAARIAAITVFTNRFAVWISVDQGNVPAEDILLQTICFGCEKANGRELEITREAIKEVLDTGLFSSRGPNRMGWGHQTYAEFLAAWYLKQHNLNLSQILSLIIHPDSRIVPQLRETTAWLAGMMPEVFQEVLKTDPDLLLQSDITTLDDENKAQLVKSLLKLHDEEKLEYFRFRHYKNLDYPGLPGQLESYICDSTKSQWSRLVAIDIARSCDTKAVQDGLADIALDPTQAYIVRQNAVQTICVIGNERSKARLKPLVLGEVCNDPEDELKGYALQATFPNYLTVEELFDNITQPKSQSIGGTYADFIASGVAERLQIQDVPVVLRWLTEQLPRRYGLNYPFQQLLDSAMLKAWQSCDEPDVLEAFASAAIYRLKKHEGILGDLPVRSGTSDNYDENRDDDIEPALKNCDPKRRQLIEAIVSISPELENNYSWLIQIIASEDIFWMIQNATSAESDRDSTIWAKLSSAALTCHNLRWKEARYVDAVLQVYDASSAMRTEFEADITPLELGSERAKQVESIYLKYQIQPPKPEPLVDPQLKQRVLRVLQEVEAGQPHLWWQVVAEMTLASNSEEYSHHKIFKADITKLPGWKEAEADTKARIIEAAKNYLNAGDPETQAWISTNNFSHPPFAGYQALYLLAKQEPECISIMPHDMWPKWMPVILKTISFLYRNETSKDGFCREIVRNAYQSNSDEFIENLIVLMRQNNSDDIYRSTKELLDQCLANLILDKIPDEDLRAGLLEIFLKDLFEDDIDKARALATSFLPTQLPKSKNLRDKAVVAARLLAVHPNNSSWVKFWSLVEQDHEFGREVVEAIALQAIREGQIEQKINEDYLANLYIFLTQQYPEIDQPESGTQGLEGIKAQIGNAANDVRMWKNYIPQHLQVKGTPEACDALRKIIRKLPELKDELQWRLLEAETLTRRKTWQPPKPEDLLEPIISQAPSNLDLFNQLETIDQRTQRMEDDPKNETHISISNSSIHAPVGTSGMTNSQVTVASSAPEKGLNSGNWLAGIGIFVAIIAVPVSMSVSGAFNEEFRQWFDSIFAPKVKQQSTPNSK